MAFFNRYTVTCTLSTLGASTTYSTGLINGYVEDISVLASGAMTAASALTITPETTTRSILKVVDPSTNAAIYFPRAKQHGTTGNVVGSTEVLTRIAVCNERLKCVVASSSGNSGDTVTVVFTVGGG